MCSSDLAPAQAAAKPFAKSMSQANTGTNKPPLDDDFDAINARLRDAYESNEGAF